MKSVYKRWRRGKKGKYILLRKNFKETYGKREAIKLGKRKKKLKM